MVLPMLSPITLKLAYNNWHKETVHDDAIQTGAIYAHRRSAGVYEYALCQVLPAPGES